MKTLAIIINIFFPGIGTLFVRKWIQAIAQLLLGAVGAALTFSAILSIVGIPLLVIVWVWALVSAITAEDSNKSA